MNKKDYKIRIMTRKELNIAVDWAAKEGWNPGLYDANAFYETDPDGYLMGFLRDEPISCISAVSYGGKFGFLGLYITKPEYRGKGYGIQIWNKAIDYLKTQNIGLDGVVAQQEKYKKSGFKNAHSNIRYQGRSRRNKNHNKNIVDLSQVSFENLLKYDNSLFPVSRPKFLKKWISLPESAAFGLQQDGNLKGYGVIRKCRTGYKIGPLFADNKNIAEALFLALNDFLEPETILFLDIPEVNKEAVGLAKQYNMNMCFETVRMYTKDQPDLPLNKVFGVTTFELG